MKKVTRKERNAQVEAFSKAKVKDKPLLASLAKRLVKEGIPKETFIDKLIELTKAK